MILGLASPTYAGAMPEANPLHWLLDRCVEYELGAMEASPTYAGAIPEARTPENRAAGPWMPGLN